MALPSSIVCFKSAKNNKYLRYRDDLGATHGLLQFSGGTVMDPFSQIQVIYADIGSKGQFVHLLSRYANKYLVRWSPKEEWITASANDKNEDETSWGCTLFEPILVYDESEQVVGLRLKHVQLNNYVSFSEINADPFNCCIFAGSPYFDPNVGPQSKDIFTFIDWVTIYKLPQTIAFKGDISKKFLGACLENGKHCLQFAYEHSYDKEVAQEVFTSPDGTVMIKSKLTGKYWRVDDGGTLVIVNGDEPIGSTNIHAMFRINVLDTDVVALLNMSNTLYCEDVVGSGEHKNLLHAATHTVDSYSRLLVTTLND